MVEGFKMRLRCISTVLRQSSSGEKLLQGGALACLLFALTTVYSCAGAGAALLGANMQWGALGWAAGVGGFPTDGVSGALSSDGVRVAFLYYNENDGTSNGHGTHLYSAANGVDPNLDFGGWSELFDDQERDSNKVVYDVAVSGSVHFASYRAAAETVVRRIEGSNVISRDTAFNPWLICPIGDYLLAFDTVDFSSRLLNKSDLQDVSVLDLGSGFTLTSVKDIVCEPGSDLTSGTLYFLGQDKVQRVVLNAGIATTTDFITGLPGQVVAMAVDNVFVFVLVNNGGFGEVHAFRVSDGAPIGTPLADTGNIGIAFALGLASNGSERQVFIMSRDLSGNFQANASIFRCFIEQ
jgi:hypothetical protein